MGDIFTSNADLSGILETGESLQVSDIYHKSILEINEGGCEAAGTTSKNSRIPY